MRCQRRQPSSLRMLAVHYGRHSDRKGECGGGHKFSVLVLFLQTYNEDSFPVLRHAIILCVQYEYMQVIYLLQTPQFACEDTLVAPVDEAWNISLSNRRLCRGSARLAKNRSLQTELRMAGTGNRRRRYRSEAVCAERTHRCT